MGAGLNIPDILSSAASSSLPQNNGTPAPTSMGPAPLAMPTPLPRLQTPEAQYGKAGNEFQTAGGRKRADREALMHSVAQTIKAGGDYVQAKKNRQLQSSIERLMSAQQGIEEAKAAMQQNSNDSKAKEAIATNTAIINDITADPKTNKMLQKAFNIDLFGNGKNKNENKALQDAWKSFGEKQKAGDKSALNPVAQKLMQSQPQRAQMSPELTMQAKMIEAKLIPGADEKLKAAVEQFKSYTTAKTSEERNISAEKIAQERAQSVTYHADKVLDAAIQNKLGREAAADIHSRTEKYKADMNMAVWNKRIGMMTEIATGKNTVQMAKITSLEKIAGDKNKTAQERVDAQKELNKIKSSQGIILSMAKEAGTYNTELARLTKENKDAQTELDKKGSSIFGIKMGAASDADSQILRNKINTNNLAMKGMQGKLGEVQKKMQTLNQMGILMLPEQASDAAMNTPESNDDPEKLFGDD